MKYENHTSVHYRIKASNRSYTQSSQTCNLKLASFRLGTSIYNNSVEQGFKKMTS